MARISLPNGCSCSTPNVYPSNWNCIGASCKEDWYITYRFHDPAHEDRHPKGKLVMVKGMNGYKTVKDRKASTEQTLKDIMYYLKVKCYNPIVDAYAPEQGSDYIIEPATPLNDALQGAFDRLRQPERKTAPELIINLRSVLKYFKQAATAAGQDSRPMEEIKRRHIVMCWEQLPIIKSGVWSDNLHNHYRAHITILMEELYKIETIEVVPMGSIPVKTVVRKKREILTRAQRIAIDAYLRQHNYRFWRLLQIFFHSGARTTEMLALSWEDVNLEHRYVAYRVKKGRSGTVTEVRRPIKDIIYHLWVEVMEEAKPGQILFGEGLEPGDKSIRREQITRRWRLWIKGKLSKELGIEITANWYRLKHLHTTEVVEQAGRDIAMKITGHTTGKMIDTVYDVRKQDREDEAVRGVRNAFA